YRVSNAGTTAAGLAVVRNRLSGLGFPVDQLQAVDGSGLDRGDRASCGLLLRAVERGGPRGGVAAGLPRAGQDGTLLHRYGGSVLAGRLRAKTGSLEGVAAFTGWLDLDRGRSLAFSLVANGETGEAAGTALEDRLATTLASYPQGPPP